MDTPRQNLGYAWYVVAVLMIAYVFSFIDRQILNARLQSLKLPPL